MASFSARKFEKTGPRLNICMCMDYSIFRLSSNKTWWSWPAFVQQVKYDWCCKRIFWGHKGIYINEQVRTATEARFKFLMEEKTICDATQSTNFKLWMIQMSFFFHQIIWLFGHGILFWLQCWMCVHENLMLTIYFLRNITYFLQTFCPETQIVRSNYKVMWSNASSGKESGMR